MQKKKKSNDFVLILIMFVQCMSIGKQTKSKVKCFVRIFKFWKNNAAFSGIKVDFLSSNTRRNIKDQFIHRIQNQITYDRVLHV